MMATSPDLAAAAARQAAQMAQAAVAAAAHAEATLVEVAATGIAPPPPVALPLAAGPGPAVPTLDGAFAIPAAFGSPQGIQFVMSAAVPHVPPVPQVPLAAAPSDGEAANVAPSLSTGGGGASAASTKRGSADSSKPRSSQYRGVTKHKRSQRWEAHIWCRASEGGTRQGLLAKPLKNGRRRAGKQVYLGGFALEAHAAEAYDVAALKVKGTSATTNFPLSKYTDLLKFLDSVTMEELVMAVRRQSEGFSRGSSSFRGVTKHPSGRWESRVGMPGSRHVYLGLFDGEQAAARAYDRALVRLRGPTASTNFSIADYGVELRAHSLDKVGREVLRWCSRSTSVYPKAEPAAVLDVKSAGLTVEAAARNTTSVAATSSEVTTTTTTMGTATTTTTTTNATT